MHEVGCLCSNVSIFLISVHCEAFRNEKSVQFSFYVWSVFHQRSFQFCMLAYVYMYHKSPLPSNTCPTPTVCNYKHPVSCVTEGYYGKANCISVSVRAGHSAEHVLTMMTNAGALCMSASETQAERNAHPFFLPSITLSLYSHPSALWPPAINNKTLLSNAESSQAV